VSTLKVSHHTPMLSVHISCHTLLRRRTLSHLNIPPRRGHGVLNLRFAVHRTSPQPTSLLSATTSLSGLSDNAACLEAVTMPVIVVAVAVVVHPRSCNPLPCIWVSLRRSSPIPYCTHFIRIPRVPRRLTKTPLHADLTQRLRSQ